MPGCVDGVGQYYQAAYFQGNRPTFSMKRPAPSEPSEEPAEPRRYGPVRRFDEAIKQLDIARELVEDDVDEELRAATAEPEAARSAIAADD